MNWGLGDWAHGRFMFSHPKNGGYPNLEWLGLPHGIGETNVGVRLDGQRWAGKSS